MSDDVWTARHRKALTELQIANAELRRAAAQQRQATAALEMRLRHIAGPSGDASTQTEDPGHRRASAARNVSRRALLRLAAAGLAGGAAVDLVTAGTSEASSGRRRSAARLSSSDSTSGDSTSGDSTSAGSSGATGATGATGVVYVPAPTGVASTDTPAVLAALQAPRGTTVVFVTNGSVPYSINQELPVPEGVRVTGSGPSNEDPRSGLMPTLQQAAGTSLNCIMASAGYLAGLYDTPQYNNGMTAKNADAGIEIDHLAFDGQNGGAGTGNTVGHGVVLYSTGSKVHDCYFVNVAQAAVVVADHNWKNQPCVNHAYENRVTDNSIKNPGWYGIWNTHTNGSPSDTDGYLIDNIVVSPSQQMATGGPRLKPGTSNPYEGIRLDNPAGWWVVGNYVGTCPGNAFYLATTWGVHLIGNVADGFGCTPIAGQAYSGFYVITAGDVKTHPGFIDSNLAAAYEGFNPLGSTAPGKSTTYAYFKVVMQLQSYDTAAFFEQSNNSANQKSVPPAAIHPAGVTSGSTTITVPNGSAAGHVQAGMSVSDTKAHLPAATTVVSVTAGTGTGPDTIVVSNASKGTATNDQLSFHGPTSVAWTYINNEGKSTVTVQRINETITGTIVATPLVQGSAKTVIIDPAHAAGGVQVHGAPAAGDTIVATSATAASWQAPPAQSAGGALAGTYPDPTYTPDRFTQFFRDGGYTVPAGVTRLRITCVGGGGAGGGGAAAVSGLRTRGGAGGSAGGSVERIVPVTAGAELTVAVGAGGAGGAGRRSAGLPGTAGGPTTVSGAGLVVTAPGGAGGSGGGTMQDRKDGQGRDPAALGAGGSDSTAGGLPFGFSPGGGGAGGPAGRRHGGGGGSAGTASSAGAPGQPGASRDAAGRQGESGHDPSAPGGGGGAGAGAAGGAGGDGAPGFAVIERLG